MEREELVSRMIDSPGPGQCRRYRVQGCNRMRRAT